MVIASDHTKEAPSEEVIKNIRNAAKEGMPQAEFELGCLLSNGEFLPKDSREAFRLFLHAAKQGYSKAQYKVGIAYFNGDGVPKDQREGLAWVYLACMNGLVVNACASMEKTIGKDGSDRAKIRSQELTCEAALQKGYAYLNGWGVERNEKKAKEWFRAATLTSVFKIYPPAIEQLSKMGEWSADLVAGHCYFSRKSEKCVYWLKRSASKGSVDAMFLLALYYSEVQKPTNHYEAYAWMQLVLSTKDNKKPVIDSISSTIDSNYIELAIFCRDKAMPDILKDYFSKDLVDKYIKDPNLITNIAQAVCEIWKQEVIGEEGALKAQQRTHELKKELISLSEQSPKAPL